MCVSCRILRIQKPLRNNFNLFIVQICFNATSHQIYIRRNSTPKINETGYQKKNDLLKDAASNNICDVKIRSKASFQAQYIEFFF